MPYVACPNCAERGKIGLNLIGARIKCRKCGTSFTVSPPVSSEFDPTTMWKDKAPITYDGIEVEGLDSSAWSTGADAAVSAPQAQTATAAPDRSAESSSAFIAATPATGSVKQYKILTTKDKFFDNKFDLNRLEEALNHYAREGWVAKGISTPQVKGFTGVFAEELVVLLER
jgi:hypothetical protein